MKCEEARLAISDRLDGALDPAIAPRLHEHLQGCDACRVEDDAFVRLDAAMAASPPPPIPSGLVKSLMRSVQPPREASISKGRLALWGLGAAASIALTALALHAYSLSLQGDGTPRDEPPKAAKSPRGRARAEGQPAISLDEDTGAGGLEASPAPARKRVPTIDAATFDALETLKERVTAKSGRAAVLDALERAGFFLELAAAESEAPTPDFASAKEGIEATGAIAMVQGLVGEFDKANDLDGKRAARELLVALRSVVGL